MLMIIGLLAVGGSGLLSAVVKRKQYSDTRNTLEVVSAYFVLFASRQHRLPCAADGTAATGTESRDAAGQSCTAISTGVVPWATLGLSESDTLDGWGNRITYRVANELVRDNSMNFSDCDPAGTAAAVGASPNQSCDTKCNNTVSKCTPISAVIINKGLSVQTRLGVSQASAAISTGAAYVLISHGENLHGAYNIAGILQSGAPAPGYAEIRNANNQALQAFYVADEPTFIDAPGRFDDLVSFKTVHAVVAQARLDARAH